ncbi:MAG TPA: hypothetical protein VEF04_02670 [Blastocatellia bacterium]|nr:hypothetical protein [Blastocatellia bacterium]
MSGKNNVNPGQYKLGGRDRVNETVLADQEKQKYAQAKAGAQQESPNLIPGADTQSNTNDSENQAQDLNQGGVGIDQADEASRSKGID